MSKQTEYLARLRERGLCVQCRAPSPTRRCPKCAKKMRLYMRARTGSQPQKKGGPGRPREL